MDTAWPGPDPKRLPERGGNAISEVMVCSVWVWFVARLDRSWERVHGAVLVPGREAELAQMVLRVQ